MKELEEENLNEVEEIKESEELEKNDFSDEEVEMVELNEEDDAMVTNAHCPYCGARYELYDTPESEKKYYPYWNTTSDGAIG